MSTINQVIAKEFENVTKENVDKLVTNAIRVYEKTRTILLEQRFEVDTISELEYFVNLDVSFTEFETCEELINDVYKNLKVQRAN